MTMNDSSQLYVAKKKIYTYLKENSNFHSYLEPKQKIHHSEEGKRLTKKKKKNLENLQAVQSQAIENRLTKTESPQDSVKKL